MKFYFLILCIVVIMYLLAKSNAETLSNKNKFQYQDVSDNYIFTQM